MEYGAPSKTTVTWTIQVHLPNNIVVISAIFAGLMVVTNRHADTKTTRTHARTHTHTHTHI